MNAKELSVGTCNIMAPDPGQDNEERGARESSYNNVGK